jgi:peptidoglycan hydrolase CwlO-like protein
LRTGEFNVNIVETLQAELTELTGRLTELDEKVNTERPGLVAQIAQLNKAIKALSKPAKTPGERKPMSEEAKAAIKAGLERARAAKLAASGQPQAKPISGTQPSAIDSAKKPAERSK